MQHLFFELNSNQAPSRFSFLGRGDGYEVLLAADECVLALRKSGVVRMRLLGAKAAPEALDPLPGRINYFLGKDPSKWRANVNMYGRVRFRRVYPGINLIYYANDETLEHDFVVAPRANPNRVRLTFEGAGGITIDAAGDLRAGRGRDHRGRPRPAGQ